MQGTYLYMPPDELEVIFPDEEGKEEEDEVVIEFKD